MPQDFKAEPQLMITASIVEVQPSKGNLATTSRPWFTDTNTQEEEGVETEHTDPNMLTIFTIKAEIGVST